MDKTPEVTQDISLELYKKEIRYYKREADKWHEQAKKIIRRYKDERSPRQEKNSRYNILYANVQTLLPAIYGKNPKADIERRFKDNDPLGRVTSDILERCTDYFVNTEDFRSALRSALFDRLVPGRGTVWSRYVPHFRPADVDASVNESDENEQPLEEVYKEEALTDYVNWEDFGHNWARTEDEIYLKWRKIYLSKEENVKRFGGELGNQIPLDYTPKNENDNKKDQAVKKSVIFEIWNNRDKNVKWLHLDIPQFLDEKDDPLRLPDFFPCPKALYPCLANDSMIPVPDYVQYQDQAMELDELTRRISMIERAVKVAGVYDASAPALDRLLAEGVENKLIPVDQWALFAEKGGMKGTISLLPMKEIAETLHILYETRDKVKQDLYEISGMADIIRGANDPTETATATNTKNKFITMRLSDAQDDMARFARDAVRNTANIIAEHFSMDTIKKISGVKLMTAQEKQSFQIQQQMIVQAGRQPKPIDEDMQELLDNPTWEEVERLLRDEPALSFKIDIETDSTIKMDEQEDKAAAVEFIEMAGKYLGQMKDAPPQAMPLLAHLLMFGVRKFRAGKQVEGQFQIFADRVEKMAEQAAANPPPDPAQIKAQSDQIMLDKKLQNDKALEQFKAQLQQQTDLREQQVQQMQVDQQSQTEMRTEMFKEKLIDRRESRQNAAENQLQAAQIAADAQKTSQDNATKVLVAQIAAQAATTAAAQSAENRADQKV